MRPERPGRKKPEKTAGTVCLFAMDEPYHKIVCLNSLMWAGCEKKMRKHFYKRNKGVRKILSRCGPAGRVTGAFVSLQAAY